jgi:hypothetical protein
MASIPSLFQSLERKREPISFLFLGEMLLVPHLYPIIEAVALAAPDVPVDIWVATSVHESLIVRWLDEAGIDGARVHIRRAPGYRAFPNLKRGENPPLPPKLPMLLRLLPRLVSACVVVCAEQTSLWLPRLFPFLHMRFVKTSHGVGSMSARDDPRRRAAWLLLVPSEAEKRTYLARGVSEARLAVTGYVKSAFRALARSQRLFANDKPTIVYAPHWQAHRSSWWAWGREIVAMLAAQDRYNIILAPHQRLVEQDPAIRDVLGAVAHLPHVHVDLDSFAMVDGSYMAAADIYLGDTSSQVVEYLIHPRPCVFLNPEAIDWRATDDHGFWKCGEVVDRLEMLRPALDRAADVHTGYEPVQRRFAAGSLGDTGPETARAAAEAILAARG